jgi:hypothetical protein
MIGEAVAIEDLVKGRMYEVDMRYQAGNGGWIHRRMIAKFLWISEYDTLTFNLRPDGNSLEIPKPWVRAILDRGPSRDRGGDQVAVLPWFPS